MGKTTLVSKQAVPIYQDFTSKVVVGKLLPTNEFEVLSKKNGRLKIYIKGYQNPKVKRALYFSTKNRILVAAFSKLASFKPHNLGKKAGFDKLGYTLFIKNANLSNNPSKLNAHAKALFQEKCSMCHSLYKPSSRPANQWPSVIKAMKQRAGFSKQQEILVSIYLQKHASDMQK